MQCVEAVMRKSKLICLLSFPRLCALSLRLSSISFLPLPYKANPLLFPKNYNTLYLSVKVFSTKVLIGNTIFTSPAGDGNAILRDHPSHAKVYSLAVLCHVTTKAFIYETFSDHMTSLSRPP